MGDHDSWLVGKQNRGQVLYLRIKEACDEQQLVGQDERQDDQDDSAIKGEKHEHQRSRHEQ